MVLALVPSSSSIHEAELKMTFALFQTQIQVVRVLESSADIDLTNGIQPGQSQLFNVANTVEIRMFRRMVAGAQDDDSSDLTQYDWSRGSDAAPSSRIL